MAESTGFEVIVHDRNINNREKKIDTSIATAITSDSYRLMNADRDEITLVASDTDYVPVVEDARERGFAFYVVFWNHASGELKRACTKFVALDDYLDHLRHGTAVMEPRAARIY